MKIESGVTGRADQRAWTTRHLTALTVSMVCLSFGACYFRFFVSLNVPILPGGDTPSFVSDGARIAAGQLPYRDFFEMLPPGTFLTYALLIKTFGLFNWIPLLAMTCLASATVLLMTLASGRIMRGNVVLLPGLLFTGIILLDSAEATHHWFSTVLVLAAMLILSGEDTLPRIVVAGVCCGAAACFTQTKGVTVLLGFATYLIWKSRRGDATASECCRRCLILCAAALAVFAAANSYFIATAGLSRWVYCLVTFPLFYYPAPSLNNWHVIAYDFQWHRSATAWISYPFVCGTVPAVYIVSLFVMRRRWKWNSSHSGDLPMLITLTGIAMFLAIAPSPSVKRLSTVSPPAMILVGWLLDRPGKSAAVLRTTLGTLAAAVAIAVAVRTQTRPLTYLDLPAGRTAFTDPTVHEEYAWVLAHTFPGQFFFGMPPFYLPFRLRNPAMIEDVDTSEYTRPEDVAALVKAIQQHTVPLMILASEDAYPLTIERPSNHLRPFVAFLRANYRLTKTFENGDEAWEKADPTQFSTEEVSPFRATSGAAGKSVTAKPPKSMGRGPDYRGFRVDRSRLAEACGTPATAHSLREEKQRQKPQSKYSLAESARYKMVGLSPRNEGLVRRQF
jgi:hypothetical protein